MAHYPRLEMTLPLKIDPCRPAAPPRPRTRASAPNSCAAVPRWVLVPHTGLAEAAVVVVVAGQVLCLVRLVERTPVPVPAAAAAAAVRFVPVLVACLYEGDGVGRHGTGGSERARL